MASFRYPPFDTPTRYPDFVPNIAIGSDDRVF